MDIGDEAPTALYRFFANDGALLYVGITGHLKARIAAHAKEKPWWPQVGRKTVEWFATRDEAIRAEDRAIHDERPVHNIVDLIARRETTRPVRKPTPGDRHRFNPMAIRFSTGTLGALKSFAKRNNRSVNSVITVALAEYLDEHEPLLDEAS